MSHDPRTPAPPAEPAVVDVAASAHAGGAGATTPPAASAAPDPSHADQDEARGDQAPARGDHDGSTGSAGQQDGAGAQGAADDLFPAPPADGEHTDLLSAVMADPRSRSELFQDLLEAEAKRDEYLDDLRRSHAELENYRKRVLRDAALQRDHGRVDVVTALLESLDDLDRTEQAGAGSDDEALAKGVTLVSAKLRDALRSIGVERIDEVGVTFDPTVHEAVQQVPGDEPRDEPQVVQVLRPGYRLGERTLRAAMVVVSQ